ncbi:MAG: NAD(P)H-dependent oxidoreductase [Flavobacteriaceae bacterium]|nr:NAD(P)H-dependent oxidoreductase [Flavobacteriaceae bacterium]
MKKIIALGASNSKESINKKLAIFVANQLQNTETIVIDLNDYDIPIYGIDYETEHGIPAQIQELSNLIASVDGVVISMAEHNGSYSAAFKSIFDWLSRVDKYVWKNKPMLLMATSPGGGGGASVLETAKNTFPRMGANLITDFSLPSFYDNFSEKGITNDELNNQLNAKIDAFQKEI